MGISLEEILHSGSSANRPGHVVLTGPPCCSQHRNRASRERLDASCSRSTPKAPSLLGGSRGPDSHHSSPPAAFAFAAPSHLLYTLSILLLSSSPAVLDVVLMALFIDLERSSILAIAQSQPCALHPQWAVPIVAVSPPEYPCAKQGLRASVWSPTRTSCWPGLLLLQGTGL